MGSKNEAQKQNPFLGPLKILVGVWQTKGTHPYFPGQIFHGRAVFEWIEDAAFLILRTEIDEPGIPSGISIFGSDNVTQEFFMLYFDERGISRKYDVSFVDNVLTWSRNTPEFAQRMVLTVSDEGTKITSRGEMSKDGGAWEPDLELSYSRIK
jgi:hypothetical protein